MSRYDEDRARLQAAVKANDGFFTTFFVSPYSKYVARFGAQRGWEPNAVTVLSFALGLAAAVAFAWGSRVGLIVGAVLVQVSFTADCVDGQLARYTESFSSFGGWLDSVFDRVKEYLIYAGLAVGSSRGFGEDVWVLAAAAIALQTVRHMSDFAYLAHRRDVTGLPIEQPRRMSLVRWAGRIVSLPIGERFALISLTAALANPRVTFIVLLGWGGVAGAYALVRRIQGSFQAARPLGRAAAR